jgi:hypothetical protein
MPHHAQKIKSCGTRAGNNKPLLHKHISCVVDLDVWMCARPTHQRPTRSFRK